jgi:hypothetical protein
VGSRCYVASFLCGSTNERPDLHREFIGGSGLTTAGTLALLRRLETPPCDEPTTFGGLLGRVMPLQVNLKTEVKAKVRYETVEEVRAGLLERGFPLKMIEAMEAAAEPKFELQRLPKPPDQVQ